ncbi:hypothetical protein FOZ60_015401, partial [Perkinsus olseni]
NDESAVNDVGELNASHIAQDYAVGNHYEFSDESVVNSAQAHAAGRSLYALDDSGCAVCTWYIIKTNGMRTCLAYENKCTGFSAGQGVGGGSFRRSLTEAAFADAVMTDGVDD